MFFKEVSIPCTCSTEEIKFKFLGEVVDDEPPLVYLGLMIDQFYEKQESILRRIFKRFKIIWVALRGQDYRLYDITVSGADNFKRLAEFFAECADQSIMWEQNNKYK